MVLNPEYNTFKEATYPVACSGVVDYIQRKLVGHEISINFLKNLRLLLTVLNVDDLIIQKALVSEFNDFEDAIQYYTAVENDIDCIITRNINDYKKSVIPVYTPTEMLNN